MSSAELGVNIAEDGPRKGLTNRKIQKATAVRKP